MKCLHCGVELALLQKLKGSAEFCCEEHRAAYEEEFSRLALVRLFEAQEPSVLDNRPHAPFASHPGTQPARRVEEDQVPAPARFLLDQPMTEHVAEPVAYDREPLKQAEKYLFPEAHLAAVEDLAAPPGEAPDPPLSETVKAARSEPPTIGGSQSRSGSLYGRLQQKGLVGRSGGLRPGSSGPEPGVRHTAPKPKYPTARRPPLREVLAWPPHDFRCLPKMDAPSSVDFSGEPEWEGPLQLQLATTGFDFLGGGQ